MLTVLAVVAGCGDGPFGNRPSLKELQALDELRQSDPARAVVKIRAELKSHSRNDLLWTILGNAHLELDEDENANKAYKRALEINPSQFKAITGMGILARRSGDYSQAMTYYKRAIAIDPNYAEAYSSMTLVALKQGQDAKALEYAKKGWDLDNTNPEIAANLAVAYHYNGMVELRDKMTEEAEKLGYENVDVLHKVYRGEMTMRD